MLPYPILFEDEQTIAVNKPAGIAVHRSALRGLGEDALLNQLRRQLGFRLYPVHRLDRATSGVLLFAKNSESAAHISQCWREGGVEKIYLAVCRGWPPESLIIDRPLQVVGAPEKAPQPARTRLIKIASTSWPVAIETYPESRLSLVALFPETGRRHQLRRHLRSMNYPLIGDTTYGRGAYNRYFRETLSCERLLLHHLGLGWRDQEQQLQRVIAPLDKAWTTVMNASAWTQLLQEWIQSYAESLPAADGLRQGSQR